MTTQDHLKAAASNLAALAEEIDLLAGEDPNELPCDHEFADELDIQVDCLMEFAGRVV
jgi:hypothetical protein